MIFFVPEETMVRYTLTNEYPSVANNGPSFSPLKVKRTGENNSMTDSWRGALNTCTGLP